MTGVLLRALAILPVAALATALSGEACAAGAPASCVEGSCHAAINRKLRKEAHVHEVAAGGDCDSCHLPHTGGRPGKLRRPLGPVCAGCHDAPAPAAGRPVHKPISDDRCQACHDPHASPRPRLLLGAFPEGKPARFDAADYGLCWGCHDRRVAAEAETTKATAFRNGRRNLHPLHLGRSKGATCLTCHEIHLPSGKGLVVGAGGPGFTATSGGGACAPPCHGSRGYDRNRPAKP